MSETNVSLNAELRDELADEIEAKIAESKKADVLLDVDDLCVTLFTEDGELPAIRHLNLVMRKGETLAVVGESGCGKSMTALSIMGLLPQPPARIVGGSINLEGTDLAKLSRDEMRSFRGSKMGMRFQEPMTSLNPVMKAGLQIREGILVHNPKMDKKEADARALEMIKLVGIPAPEKVFKSYPHELSGGMRQRVMIAMALACQPSLLICDEPTTALDVTIQAQILQLIDHMREELGTAVMLITHDMGVVSELADDVAVMYMGSIVERGSVRDVLKHPAHPYTSALLRSIPVLHQGKNQRLEPIRGSTPDPYDRPKGCQFAPRCDFCCDKCTQEMPPEAAVCNGHAVRCWNADKVYTGRREEAAAI